MALGLKERSFSMKLLLTRCVDGLEHPAHDFLKRHSVYFFHMDFFGAVSTKNMYFPFKK